MYIVLKMGVFIKKEKRKKETYGTAHTHTEIIKMLKYVYKCIYVNIIVFTIKKKKKNRKI